MYIVIPIALLFLAKDVHHLIAWEYEWLSVIISPVAESVETFPKTSIYSLNLHSPTKISKFYHGLLLHWQLTLIKQPW